MAVVERIEKNRQITKTVTRKVLRAVQRVSDLTLVSYAPYLGCKVFRHARNELRSLVQ